MESSSNDLLSASAQIQDLEYLYASNINVSNFVSVKLSGNGNYVLWKAQMVCLLDSISMCGIMDATFVGPRDSDTKTVKKYDSLVKGWIFGSVSEDVLVDIYNLDSAKAVWEKIKSNYEPTMCLQEDSTVEKSVTKMKKEDRERHAPEEDPNSIEILVGKDIVPAETEIKTEDTQNNENKIKHKNNSYELSQLYKKMREATIYDDWLKLERILGVNKDLVAEAIISDGSTILHIAVGIHNNDIVKKLLRILNEEQLLRKRDSDGSTVLHVAAIVGNKHAAELLIKKTRKLLRIVDHNGEDPLHKAYENMHLNTIVYLLEAINDDGKTELQSSLVGSFRPSDKIVVDILVNAITAKQYGLAIELVKKFPTSASASDDVLMAIAKTFPSGLDDGEKLIYPFLHIFMEYITLGASSFFCSLPHIIYDEFNEAYKQNGLFFACFAFSIFTVLFIVPFMAMITFTLIIFLILIACFLFLVFYYLLWKCAKILVPWIKDIEKKKKEWDGAKKVLELVCDEIDKLDYTGTHHPYYRRPILEAACHNAHKVVDEILSRSPEAIQNTDKNGYDIIQLATINRSERIYNLIYDLGERRNLYRTIVDPSKNNMLHLVGRLAPSNVLNQRTGAALQLQRELQWREEVKKLVFPTYITKENMFKETPDMVFTREHKDLVKEGERWMKTTAESCSITAALITTIVFAAAITVPGGNSQDKGTPLFKKEVAFIIFAISDAISLFTSATALLVFLSILTTRFAENDFLVSLPRRLVIGLFSLLVSTTAMIVAFSATLFLVFCDKKPWMLIPICGLAVIPIASFVTLQLPLMTVLSLSTYFRIFGKRRTSIVKYYRFNLGR